MCVERWKGGVQHAAPHVSVAIIQSIGNEEKEERGDLRFIQVLRELVQSQSNATPGNKKTNSAQEQHWIQPQSLETLLMSQSWCFCTIYGRLIQNCVALRAFFLSLNSIRPRFNYLASHWSGGASEMTLPSASSTGGGLFRRKREKKETIKTNKHLLLL